MKKEPYEDLALLPFVLAELVVNESYTNSEMSISLRCARMAKKVEILRLQMSDEQKEKFIEICDIKCEKAYNAGSKWFMKCVEMEDGRDYLQMYFRHWLSSYLLTGEIGETKAVEL